jgi:hypothetical protein
MQVDNIIMTIFICDLILNFFTLREAPDGTVPRSRIYIAKVYCTSLWLPLDFIATFPWDKVSKLLTYQAAVDEECPYKIGG